MLANLFKVRAVPVAIAVSAASAAAILLFGGAAQADTYSYSGPTFPSGQIGNHTAPVCTGTCADYTTSSHITGSFTTAGPLAPNLTDFRITPTAFSFTDGINTFANTDAQVRVLEFEVSTNASGAVSGSKIELQQWAGGGSPHNTTNRVNELDIVGVQDVTDNNDKCLSVGITGSGYGTADVCTGPFRDASSSNGYAFPSAWASPTPPAPPAAIPTLGEWATILLGLLIGGAGLCYARRRASFST